MKTERQLALCVALPLVALRIWDFPQSIPATNGSGRMKTERQLALCVALPLVRPRPPIRLSPVLNDSILKATLKATKCELAVTC
jgi:hypothetical protein